MPLTPDTQSSTQSVEDHHSDKMELEIDPKLRIRAFLDRVKGSVFAAYLGSNPEAKKDRLANQLHRTWYNVSRSLTRDDEAVIMHRNATHALTECTTFHPHQSVYCITMKELLSCFTFRDQHTLGAHTFSISSKQGKRKTMEDVCLAKGNLFAIFDGHGGVSVADYACRRVFEEIPQLIQTHSVYSAFDQIFKKINEEIKSNASLRCGSTALTWYIHPMTHEITLASIGDCKLGLCRRIDDKWTYIPLSSDRSWNHLKEALRAAYIKNEPSMVQEWCTSLSPTHLRFPNPMTGINCSRALGDHVLNEITAQIFEGNDFPGVLGVPKIAHFYAQKGDILVGSCDGVILTVKQLLERVERFADKPSIDLADIIVNDSLELGSTDNTTAIVVRFV